MAIVITTNQGQQVFETKDEVFKPAVQAEESNDEIQEPEKKTDESATEENRDKSFDYLDNPETEDDESDDDHDIDDEEAEEEDSKPKKNGFKKRIDKLTKKNSDYEARIAQLESQLRGGNQQKTTEQQQPVKVEEIKEPSINDFEEYGDYLKALAKYEVNEERKKENLRIHEENLKTEAEKITQAYRARVEEAKKRYGNTKWDSLRNVDLPLSIEMRSEIMQSEVGPDVLFFLYHNLEENKRINSLTPAQQIKEFAKLEIKLSEKLKSKAPAKDSKKSEKVSNAPAPMKPISSRTDGKVAKDPSKMSYQEYKAWREAKNKK